MTRSGRIKIDISDPGLETGSRKMRRKRCQKYDMKPILKSLEDKRKKLDQKIAEVKKRMPAHSVKPPIMMELFALEDERDLVEKQIAQLEKGKD